jgi:hypothetical protein
VSTREIGASVCAIWRAGKLKQLAKTSLSIGEWGGVGRKRSKVDTRRSYYLACRQDDFAEIPPNIHKLQSCKVIFTPPANDNLPSKARLSALCRRIFLWLVAKHLSPTGAKSLVRLDDYVTNG